MGTQPIIECFNQSEGVQITSVNVPASYNTTYCYRPQRSSGKVIFSQASVILFTGGGCLVQGECLVPGGSGPGGALVRGDAR